MYWSLHGNMGLGKAIEYFTSHQIPISIPLNDTQGYDLVADFDGSLKRIQVKTTINIQPSGKSYEVQLRNCGGNRTGSTRVVLFDKMSCDYIFVYTAANKTYLIPTSEIDNKSTINVGIKYEEYEVYNKQMSEYLKEMESCPRG